MKFVKHKKLWKSKQYISVKTQKKCIGRTFESEKKETLSGVKVIDPRNAYGFKNLWNA